MPNSRDFYELLGVSPTATAKEIKAAYRTLAKKLHPDVGGSADALAAVNEAADVLTDATRRAEYDRTRSGTSSARRPAEPEPRRPRQKITVALCAFCDTMNRVKDDPDYVYAKCGHCGRALGKAGREADPTPEPPKPKASEPAAKAPEAADQDSFGRLFADAAQQLLGGRLKGPAKNLPGAQKILEGLQELTDHLASRGATPDPRDQATNRMDDLDKYMKKMQDRAGS